jgi:hypothetical protein
MADLSEQSRLWLRACGSTSAGLNAGRMTGHRMRGSRLLSGREL